MRNLIVVDHPARWPLELPNAEVVSARTYLTDAAFSEVRRAKVFNLCRSYRYQSMGYYVSLLAVARGHKPLPGITTIQDMRFPALARAVAGDLEELYRRSLRPLTSDVFVLSVYFGRNLAKRYDDLSSRLFRLFPVPMLRAEFRRDEQRWQLRSIRAVAANDVPENHRQFAIDAARRFFKENRLPARARQAARYEIAVLHDPQEPAAPSNPAALRKFAAAARRLGARTELIEKADFGRLVQFDALFIRATTRVDHHTYRFARKAAAEGLAVIDDPESIVRCTNKVYLAELLTRNRVPTPRTMIVHRENRGEIAATLGLPCILKQPDSSFSQGVFKLKTETELAETLDRLLEQSDLLIAQEFVPTAYDWRIGVLDRQPLYACRYHMARRHWQIAHAGAGRTTYGKVEAVALGEVPPRVLKAAGRAAGLIGDGLYGVDLKELPRRVVVIEVNDNPTIETRCEDGILKNELYERILAALIRRIPVRGGAGR